MHKLLSLWLADHANGEVFRCFGLWHWLYMAGIFALIGLAIFVVRGREPGAKQQLVCGSIALAFGLYMLDFFLMPFAYGQIDLEKLPFHMCTAMCVLSFCSRHSAVLGKFRIQFAILGLASNLIYVIYPAGVGWYQIHPLSYRVVQTLLFHGVMSAYGIFTLVFEVESLPWKERGRDLLVICGMTIWALLGNAMYNGLQGRFFNWFFVVRDPFYLLPEAIAPYVMPFVMVGVIFVADILICAAWHSLHRKTGRA